MGPNDKLPKKADKFSLRIVRLYSYLKNEKNEHVMSKQLLRSGTSIGANIAEAIYAESGMDFIHKLSIARKEGSESQYWMRLLWAAEIIDQIQYESIYADCDELMKLLTTTIKTKLNNLKK